MPLLKERFRTFQIWVYEHLAPNGANPWTRSRSPALCPIQVYFRLLIQSTRHHPTGRFISDDAQSVTAFATETMDQFSRILMR